MNEALQQRAQELIGQAIEDAAEYGVQAAAYLGGQCILNISAGIADVDKATPVTAETLFPVFSVTKGVAAAAMHWLVERGTLRYEAPVAQYWPQFARNGKQSITIGQVLWHTAGLARLPAELTGEQIAHWQYMADLLCRMEPRTAPGSQMEYHAMTYGWLLGEVARRVGCPMKPLIEGEICAALNISDLFLGIDASQEHLLPRIATLYEPGAAAAVGLEPTSIPPAAQPLSQWMNTRQARAIPLPATAGILSAHAIARFYAGLLPGGIDGVELLPPQRVRKALRPAPGVTPDGPRPMAMGFRTFPDVCSADPPAFGHVGYGGSLGLAVPSLGLSFGFTHNLFSPRGEELRTELLRLLMGNQAAPK